MNELQQFKAMLDRAGVHYSESPFTGSLFGKGEVVDETTINVDSVEFTFDTASGELVDTYCGI